MIRVPIVAPTTKVDFLHGILMTNSTFDSIANHFESRFGRVETLLLGELVPSTSTSVTVGVCHNSDDEVTIFTAGLSSRPMQVPRGGEPFQFAELKMRLPANWIYQKVEPANIWPLRLLMDIAQYPHANRTWLGGPFTVIANGDPPVPLGPNVRFDATLLLAEPESEGGIIDAGDGKRIQIFSAFPLYPEERMLEQRKSIAPLLGLFEKYGISFALDISRKNTVLEEIRARG